MLYFLFVCLSTGTITVEIDTDFSIILNCICTAACMVKIILLVCSTTVAEVLDRYIETGPDGCVDA